MSVLLRPNLPAAPAAPKAVRVYPESDGKPMADNSKQLRWIVVLFDNLMALFRAEADVLVGGNMLWYPKEDPFEGPPQAPDVFVVCGRPKGDRGSYQQWVEDNIPMTVVFEVLSPGNTYQEMSDKFAFYDEHGVAEYYIYDPARNRLEIYLRRGSVLVRHYKVNGFVSPQLGIRFDLSGPEMAVFYPDGRRFLSFEELEVEREREHKLRIAAEQRADQAKQFAARLGELSRKARRGQASEEELQELDRLEEQSAASGTP